MRPWARLATACALLLTGAIAWLASRDSPAARSRDDGGDQSPAGHAPAAPAGEAPRVSGVVVFGDAPAPGAYVALVEAPGFWAGSPPQGPVLAEAHTDAEGRFTLAAAFTHAGIVHATLEGTAPAWRLVRPDTREVRIELPALDREEPWDLVRTGALEGIVRDEEGRPVPRAVVRASTESYDAEAREATADDLGRYRIEGLRAGLLGRCLAAAPGGVRQPCGALPAAPVPADGTLAFDIALRPGVALAGDVRTGAGQPAPGAPVALERIEDTSGIPAVVDRLAETRTDARGSFRFTGLVAGRYLVHVNAGGRYPRESVARVQPGLHDRAEVAIEDSPPSAVSLVLPATATVVGVCDRRRAGEQGSLRIEGFYYSTLVDERGELRFENVPASPRGDIWLGEVYAGPFVVPAGETVAIAINSKPRAVFQGVVEDPDGLPLAGARVFAGDEGTARYLWAGPRVVTDGAGRFRIELGEKDVAEHWAIVATCPGFVAGTVRGVPQPERGATVEVRVRLARGVRLEGVVVDEAGIPVAQALVCANVHNEDWPMRTCTLPSTLGESLDRGPFREDDRVRSDALGRFVIENLAPGTYWLSAHAELGSSGEVEVEAGAAPVRLVLVSYGLAIRGVVVDEEGRRVRYALVSLEPDLAEITDVHGRFRLGGVPPGVHDLRVEPSFRAAANGTPGFAPREVSGVKAGAEDLVIRVGPGRRLLGRVLAPDGSAVADALVLVLPPPVEDPPMTEPYTPNAKTSADGSFELRGVDPGTLEIGVFARGFLYGDFEAQAGGEPVVLHLSQGAVVEGVVLDPNGRKKSAHYVALKLVKATRPEELDPWRRRIAHEPRFWTRTDEDGRFAIAGLPDGEYVVDAGRTILPLHVQSGQKGVTLREERLLSISGTVLDELGQPATHDGQGARLRISAYSGERILGFIPLESDGSFRFDNVPPGPIQLQVRGYPRFESVSLDVPAGSHGIRIQLQPGRWRDQEPD